MQKSADPVQMPKNVASDQVLQYLLAQISMENTVNMKTSTRNPVKLEMDSSK